MNLTIPAMPPILTGSSLPQWEKWFAFWSLPLNYKADIVDEYPALLIDIPAPAGKVRAFFNPEVLDTQVPSHHVFQFWSSIRRAESFPKQDLKFELMGQSDPKQYLFESLDSLHYAVLAYKYRYEVRPETFHFGMDYDQALLQRTTLDELMTFYDFK